MNSPESQRTGNKKKRLLRALVVVLSLSLATGMTDFLITRFRGWPLLSLNVDTYRDGGSRLYRGLGYELIALHELFGIRGPRITFWWLPIPISWTRQDPEYERSQGRFVLTGFLTSLGQGRYDDAAGVYGGSYDALREWNPSVSPDDHASLLRCGCTINGLRCLRQFRIESGRSVGREEFSYDVKLVLDDGSIFSVKESGETADSLFSFRVQKIDGRFRVVDLPPVSP